jgi:hypothetical protein
MGTGKGDGLPARLRLDFGMVARRRYGSKRTCWAGDSYKDVIEKR